MLMSVLLLTALGIALVLMTSTETMIASNYNNSQEALYAAEAGLERATEDVLTVPNWNTILAGQSRSAFIDGPPAGTRALPGGAFNLTQAQNVLNCGKVAGCSSADMNAVTAARPWGVNNPRWQLYAYAPLNEIVPTGTVNTPFYVVGFVADDASESDGDPLVDSNGAVTLRAESFGPGNAHKVVETTLARAGGDDTERGYIGQRGQDEQNRGARRGAVQTPGRALTRAAFAVTTGGKMQ